MLRSLTSSAAGVLVCLFVFALTLPGHCQANPSDELIAYAFVHPFGLSSATTARQFGMGGPVTCVWDRGFANPAFAALQQEPNAGLRYSTTNFDLGPTLRAVHAHYAHPLPGDAGGLQLSMFRLSSGVGTLPAPYPLDGVVTVKMSEEDIALHYGRRPAPGWAAGISVTPYSRINFSVRHPLWDTVMDIEAKADIGARLGVAYEWAPGGFAGLVFDRYQETATGHGLAFEGERVRRVFKSELFALGVSHLLRPDVLAAVEYCTARTFDGSLQESLSGWRLGAEYRPAGTPYAARAGINDKRPTLGLGYENRQWLVDYAFMSRWNDDIARESFGGSDTHQLQATYHW